MSHVSPERAGPRLQRSQFSAEEDAMLYKIVPDHLCRGWDVIAQFLPGRNARQCRERWKHYLSCGTTSAPWSLEEDQIVFEKISSWRPKWARVAEFLGNRTDIEVKMWWLKKFNHVLPMIPKSARGRSVTQGERPPPTNGVVAPSLEEHISLHQLLLTATQGGGRNPEWIDGGGGKGY
jgi:hypothetical protein